MEEKMSALLRRFLEDDTFRPFESQMSDLIQARRIMGGIIYRLQNGNDQLQIFADLRRRGYKPNVIGWSLAMAIMWNDGVVPGPAQSKALAA